MKRLSLIVLSALIGACSSLQPASKATLEGEAFYLQRIALPPSAVLTVSLQDVSLAAALPWPWPGKAARSPARCHCRSSWNTTRLKSNRVIVMP